MQSDTFIVIDIELPFKCNPEDFEKIYQDEYKGKITHRFIRSGLNLSDSVRLKLNGTFEIWLYLIDEDSCLYMVRYKIQTALWFNDGIGKWQYISIFPNFIKRWYQPCLNMLEYISLKVGKGEDILKHIDDPKELILCEDRIAGAVKRLETRCTKLNVEALPLQIQAFYRYLQHTAMSSRLSVSNKIIAYINDIDMINLVSIWVYIMKIRT